MKTTNDLKLLIEENKSNIKVLTSEINSLYKVTPYTDRVAEQVKDKYKKIEKAQAKIAELRQSIIYLESTPPPTEFWRATRSPKSDCRLSNARLTA